MSFDSANMFDVLADLEEEIADDLAWEEHEDSGLSYTEYPPENDTVHLDEKSASLTPRGNQADQQQAKTGRPMEAVDAQHTKLPMIPHPEQFHALDSEEHPSNPTRSSTKSGKPSHRRRRDQSIHPPLSSPSPPTTLIPATTEVATTHGPPRELFIFTSRKSYALARALFATTAEPNHPSALRWCQVVFLLNSEPIGCEIMYSAAGGVGATVVRPARWSIRPISLTHRQREGKGEREGQGDETGMKKLEPTESLGEGKEKRTQQWREESTQTEETSLEVEVHVERATVVLHRPHGGPKAWCHRNVLDNMAGALMGAFGWERGDFVFRSET